MPVSCTASIKGFPRKLLPSAFHCPGSVPGTGCVSDAHLNSREKGARHAHMCTRPQAWCSILPPCINWTQVVGSESLLTGQIRIPLEPQLFQHGEGAVRSPLWGQA